MKISDLTQKRLFRGTWTGADGNDRKGTSQEYLKTSRSDGPRVVVHHWLDTGEVVVSAVKGNAFKNSAGFKQFVRIEHLNPTPAALRAMMELAAQALDEV